MEKVKIWTAITSLFVVLAVIFSWIYLERVDLANASFQEAKVALEGTRSSLASKKQNLQKRIAVEKENEAANAILKDAGQVLLAAEAAHKDALAKEREVRRGIQQLLAEMMEAVSARRSKAAGKEYPEVRLKDGKVFTAARIRKIEEDTITFLHSGGIGSASVGSLPDAFLVEYDMGPNAIVAQLRDLEASLDKVRSQPAPEEPAAVPLAVPQGMSDADRTKLQGMKFTLVELQSKLAAATANRDVLEQQVTQASLAVTNAQNRGVPTTNLRIAHQKASSAVLAANNYILGIQAEIAKLQIRISEFEPGR